jgi:spore germination protein
MEIYVEKPNDTINAIADKYDLPVKKIILDNELTYPYTLVPGQTIVISYPKQTYITKEGDTLERIAKETNVSQMQLLRNNPFLSDTPVLPGEMLTISYDTNRKITTGGYIYPYIDKNILEKTLPYLTYLTIYNYRATSEGKIITYFDDTQVVQTAREYGTIPLLMATTLSLHGAPDLETAYNILLNEDLQDIHIQEMLAIIRNKGYLGVNVVLYYMNLNNLYLYIRFVAKISEVLQKEGYLFCLTINPNIKYVNGELSFHKIDYNSISQIVTNITFLQFIWGANYGPPSPVNSIYQLEAYVNYLITHVSPKNILVGDSIISYDWQLPYIPGSSSANSISLNSSLRLAKEYNGTIQFDTISQSPFFTYIHRDSTDHIVWSVDARSISSLMNLVTRYELNGASFWNLMTYTAQLWLVINSQYEIEKLIPSKFN